MHVEPSHLELYPGRLSEYKEVEDGLVFISESQVHFKIQWVNDHIIRFRYAQYGLFERDFSYALDPELTIEVPEYTVKDNGDKVIVELREFTIAISREKLTMSLLNKEGKTILADEKGYHWEEHPEYGGNIVQMTKHVQGGEAFFGLGDKATHMNMRGKRLKNWGTDEYGFHAHQDPLYKNIPFFYGLHGGIGYGIFFDNTFEAHFDFGSERQNVYSFWAMGGEMNYYYIHGPALMDVARHYATLTGKPELPPLWALGYQQSKWSYYPESQVRDITKEMRVRKIPCDVIHIDIDYMDGFRCFTWDKEKFPDPPKMIRELREEGFKTVVIIDPGIKIDFEYDVFKEGLEKGYFCKRADGPYVNGKVWPGDCYFPDFTRAEVREWWAGLFSGLIESDQVDGVWNDMNEPALFEVASKTFPNDVRHDFDGDPCSHRKAHNVYGMQMTRATHMGVKRHKHGKRPLVITRSCYSGIQRYSAAWTGDNLASWTHLWIASIQCQRLAISGLSFVGSDVGGFIMQPSGELFVRWMQLALFHPFFRTHSSGDHGDQEPWSFGETYTDLVRSSIELRYQLLPYLYTTFYQNYKYGTPFLRPLAFVDQTDQNTIQANEAFMAGDHILNCPVLSPGGQGRMIYLPKGKWYNFWTGEAMDGGKELWVDVPMDKTAMLIRSGAVIPFYPVQQYVNELDFDTVTLHVYRPDIHPKDSEWYEDDGESYEHESGAYKLHTFVSSGTEKTWLIQHAVEGQWSSPIKHFEIFFHGLAGKKANLVVDGKEIEFSEVVKVPSDFINLKLQF